MPKKIIIGPGCIACGLCLGSPYIEELPDGTAKVKGAGIVTDAEEVEFLQVVDGCPAKAISLKAVSSKSKNDIINLMNQDAEKFVIPLPPISDFGLEEKHLDIQAPFGVPGQYQANYSSYNSAKRAAEQAIDSAFYSQRKSEAQKVINNYRVDKLSRFYEYKEVDNNFYYTANQAAQKVLDSWVREIQILHSGIKLPESLVKIQLRPENKKDYVLQGIESDLLYFADSVMKELSGSLYSLSSYADYCDIDDQEEYAGTGMFGREKYVTKYYFYNTDKAFKEMENDLKDACRTAFRDCIVEQAYSCLKYVVEGYSKKLQDELKKKASELSKQL